MDGVILLGFYVLGLISGVIGTISLTIYIGTRAVKKRKEEQANPKKMSVSDRMKRVKELQGEQLELAQRADGPQKNGLDGKYKNGLNGEIKRIEEEKTAILVSIIEDGHDPELTTMDASGVVTQMKLSEYMAYLGIKMQSKKSAAATPKTERIGKFTVVKGGKDDGGNTTH